MRHQQSQQLSAGGASSASLWLSETHHPHFCSLYRRPPCVSSKWRRSSGRKIRSALCKQWQDSPATHCERLGQRGAAGTACLCCAAACWASAGSFPAASALIPAPGSAPRVSPPGWSETTQQPNDQQQVTCRGQIFFFFFSEGCSKHGAF